MQACCCTNVIILQPSCCIGITKLEWFPAVFLGSPYVDGRRYAPRDRGASRGNRTARRNRHARRPGRHPRERGRRRRSVRQEGDPDIARRHREEHPALDGDGPVRHDRTPHFHPRRGDRPQPRLPRSRGWPHDAWTKPQLRGNISTDCYFHECKYPKNQAKNINIEYFSLKDAMEKYVTCDYFFYLCDGNSYFHDIKTCAKPGFSRWDKSFILDIKIRGKSLSSY